MTTQSEAYAVPLQEQLSSVPDKARLVIDDPDGMGIRFIPVGRMCNEAAAELRRLHSVNAQLLEALEFVMTATGEQLSTAFEQAQDAIAAAKEQA